MPAVDTCLFVGPGPFRHTASTPADLASLKNAADLSQAAATGFASIFYHDPSEGLQHDLDAYRDLADWLSFYAVINPDFPRPEQQLRMAAGNPRVVGARLFPSLHHYELDTGNTVRTLQTAAEVGLPVVLTARLFDGRIAPRCIRQTDIDRRALLGLLQAVPEANVILSMFFFAELAALDTNWNDLPNVFIDLGCSKPTVSSFDTLASWFPPERVLFGTGAPFYYWKGSRLALHESRLTPAQKQAILTETAEEVLRWS